MAKSSLGACSHSLLVAPEQAVTSSEESVLYREVVPRECGMLADRLLEVGEPREQSVPAFVSIGGSTEVPRGIR